MRSKKYGHRLSRDTMTEDFLSEFNRKDEEKTEYAGDGFIGESTRIRPEKEERRREKAERKKAKKAEKKERKNSSGKGMAGWKKVLIVLIILLAVCAAGAYVFLDSQLSRLDTVDVDISEFDIDERVADDLSDYRNVAILGVDARAGESHEVTRTDAIIVASLDKKTGDVKLISVMRDSYLEMDSSTGDKMFDKATHAHVFGGPVNTCRMLNRSLDLNISEFIVMDWNSVADTVDALGGITVDVKDYEISDLNRWGPETAENTGRTWTPIYNTGKQKIDGAQAATYCRIRKTSGGDTGRTERMRKVVMSILKEVKNNPSKITSVADKVLPEITTNMGTMDITTLLPQVVGFNISDSCSYPADYYGGMINGGWYAVPTTLEENAVTLHSRAFEQEDYIPTDRLKSISDAIIQDTGISEGTESE